MAVTDLETRRDRRRWAALALLCVASFYHSYPTYESQRG
jgi:hypothetical protein